MPYLETTRTGTASCDISLSWEVTVYPANEDPFTAKKIGWVDGIIGGLGSHTGAYSTWTWSWWSEPFGATWDYEVRLYMTSNDGYGHTMTYTKIVASGTGTAAQEWIDLSGTLTGTWSCSVGTDVLWDVTESTYSSLTAPTQFPPYTTYDWYELSRYGVNPSCNLTLGGTSVTATGTYTAGARHRMLYTFGATLAGLCEDEASTSASITNILVNTKNVGGATHTHSYLGQSATNWSVTLDAATQESNTVDLVSIARIPAVCDVQAKIYAWDVSYPDQLTMRVTGFDHETTGYRDINGTGVISGSDTFYFYSFDSYIVVTTLSGTNSSSLITALDSVPTTVSAAITAGSLTTVGDDYQSTRILFRGWRFNGAVITHDGTKSIAGTGNDRTYTPMVCMSAYRFLRVELKTQSGTNIPAVIEITDFHGYTKRWNVTVPSTTYTTFEIDLCGPNYHSIGALPSADGKDDPYPRENTVNNAYAGQESVDSAYWGVTYAQRLRVFSGAVDMGTTLLARTGHTHSLYIPSGRGHSVERQTKATVSEAGTTTTYYARRFWQQSTDERTEEESDVWWQKTEGGATGVTSWTVSLLSIKQLCDEINATDNTKKRHDGWTATNTIPYAGSPTCTVSQPPLHNCFTNGETGRATWLYGGGILVTPKTGGGTDYNVAIDINGHGGTATITAQTLFDAIVGDFIPDLYDPWNVHQGTDTALYMRGGAIYRGRAHGITLNELQQFTTGITINLIQVSNSANRGSDISAADGVYRTEAPYGFGGITHRADHQYGTTYTFNNWYTSKQHRAVFSAAAPTSGCLSADVANWLTGVYATIASGTSNVIIHIQTDAFGASWEDIDTGFVADCAIVNWSKSSSDGLLICTYIHSGTIYRRTSSTYGKAWSVATTIGTGNNLSSCVSAYGNQYIFYRKTTTAPNGLIKCVVLDSVGNVAMAEHTVIGTGVSDNPTACYVRDSTIYLLYRDTSNNVIIVTSDNQGFTFS